MSEPRVSPAARELDQACLALNAGDLKAAKTWAVKAIRLDPNNEAPWIILAANAESTDSIRYCLRALEINPKSLPARKALRDALKSQRKSEPHHHQGNNQNIHSWWNQDISQKGKVAPAAPATATINKKAHSRVMQPKRKGWIAVLAGSFGLIVVACLAVGLWLIIPGGWVAQANNGPGPRPAGELEKATITPTATTTSTATFTQSPTATNTATATTTSTSTPSATFSPVPSDTVSPPWIPTVVPYGMHGFLVAPPETSHDQNPGDIAGRWIDVNLNQQMVHAFEGTTIVNSFTVSTGTSLHPTVTGQYNIYVKYRSGSMTGPGYYLPNVPYIMYFYKGYGLHGTYWHNNFGTPMSHGCVNLRTEDAAWLFHWASVGTLVNIHY